MRHVKRQMSAQLDTAPQSRAAGALPREQLVEPLYVFQHLYLIYIGGPMNLRVEEAHDFLSDGYV